MEHPPLLNNVRCFDHVTYNALSLSVIGDGGWTWWRTVVTHLTNTLFLEAEKQNNLGLTVVFIVDC